jgi:hypothetical protein
LAFTGFVDTLDQVVELIQDQFNILIANPTIETALSLSAAPDIINVFVMNFFVDVRISQLLDLEQSDVAAYSEKLISDTTYMVSAALIYTICILVLIWIPTIHFLQKRIKLVRRIFFLLPLKVLRGNDEIKNFFKKW